MPTCEGSDTDSIAGSKLLFQEVTADLNNTVQLHQGSSTQQSLYVLYCHRGVVIQISFFFFFSLLTAQLLG